MSDLHPIFAAAIAGHMHAKPRDGALRANATDYDGEIVIERFGYWQGAEPHWAVPAWEEEGRAELAGPFSSLASAERAIRNH